MLSLPQWLSGKESACQCRRCGFGPWVGKILLRRKWQPTPMFLPGESHGERSPVGYSPWGRKESDMTEQLSTHTSPFLQTCNSSSLHLFNHISCTNVLNSNMPWTNTFQTVTCIWSSGILLKCVFSFSRSGKGLKLWPAPRRCWAWSFDCIFCSKNFNYLWNEILHSAKYGISMCL